MVPYLVHYTGRVAIKRSRMPPALSVFEKQLSNFADLIDVRGLTAEAPPEDGTELDRWIIVDVGGWTPDSLFRTLSAPGPGMSDVHDRIRRIEKLPGIETIEPEVIFRAVGDGDAGFAASPPAPLPPEWDWHHRAIGLDQTKYTGSGVTIGHLDTGIDRAAARILLGERLIEGADYHDGADIQESVDVLRVPPWHGTGTLGLLAADAPGYRGVALRANVISARVSPSVLLIRNTALASAIRGIADSEAQLMTISMGGAASPLWADAVDYAYTKGALICAAAGNNFGFTPSCVGYPARLHQVVAVAGITRDENVPYSDYKGLMKGNHGEQVDICAPTPDVSWATPDGAGGVAYVRGAGTSTATPQVAGVAALWLERWAAELASPAFTGRNAWRRLECCRRALLGGARRLPGQIGHDSRRGHGCVDVPGTLHERWRPSSNVLETRRQYIERPWWRTLNPCDDT